MHLFQSSLKNFLSISHSLFLDVLSPAQCAYCYTFLPQRLPLCTTCDSMIKPLISTKIEITKNYSLQVHAVSSYENPLRKLLLGKNSGNIVASRQLADIALQKITISALQADYFIPLPLHWTRYAWRGFNQSEVMAQFIARASHKKVINLLSRTRRTPFQASLNSEERTLNIKNAFYLNPVSQNFADKHLVLVDDLMTTGATLHAAAKLLIQLKPASVSALVICRVI